MQPITDASPGEALFPEYESLYDLIASEVACLSDEELDFESARWEWAAWSIRRQLSHMSSLIYRWLILRWGATRSSPAGTTAWRTSAAWPTPGSTAVWTRTGTGSWTPCSDSWRTA